MTTITITVRDPASYDEVEYARKQRYHVRFVRLGRPRSASPGVRDLMVGEVLTTLADLAATWLTMAQA